RSAAQRTPVARPRVPRGRAHARRRPAVNPFGHVDLRVRDMASALPFYEQLMPALGLTQRYDGPQWKVFATTGELPATASVGLAAKHALGAEVSGWDPDPAALAGAAERGAIDRDAGSLEDAVAGAELAVVAAPVAQLPGQVQHVLRASTDCTVTDVGSTKAWIADA